MDLFRALDQERRRCRRFAVSREGSVFSSLNLWNLFFVVDGGCGGVLSMEMKVEMDIGMVIGMINHTRYGWSE